MKPFFLYILLLCNALLYSAISYSQSYVGISMADSSFFNMEVNNVLISDSLLTKFELEFSSGNKANLVIIDSTNTTLLTKDLNLVHDKKREYELKNNSGSWALLLISESDFSLEVSPEVISSRSLSSSIVLTENKTEEQAEWIQIKTPYATKSAPNLSDINALDDLVFQREKIKAIESLLKEKNLTTNELILVLGKISFEDKRAELIEDNSTLLKGKLTTQHLNNLFKLDKYKTKAKADLDL